MTTHQLRGPLRSGMRGLSGCQLGEKVPMKKVPLGGGLTTDRQVPAALNPFWAWDSGAIAGLFHR